MSYLCVKSEVSNEVEVSPGVLIRALPAAPVVDHVTPITLNGFSH